MIENPTNYKELFKVFEILLTAGIIDALFVNNWADNILSKESESEYEFIELSTTNKINDLSTLLKRLSANCNLKISQRAVFGILYNSTFEDFPNVKVVSQTIYRFVYDDTLSEMEKGFLYGIDDSIELALTGVYGDIHALKNELWDFLEIYKALNFINSNNWITINNKIEENLERNLKKIQDKYSLQ